MLVIVGTTLLITGWCWKLWAYGSESLLGNRISQIDVFF